MIYRINRSKGKFKNKKVHKKHIRSKHSQKKIENGRISLSLNKTHQIIFYR